MKFYDPNTEEPQMLGHNTRLHGYLKAYSAFFQKMVHTSGVFTRELSQFTARCHEIHPDKQVIGFNSYFCMLDSIFSNRNYNDWGLVFIAFWDDVRTVPPSLPPPPPVEFKSDRDFLSSKMPSSRYS